MKMRSFALLGLLILIQIGFAPASFAQGAAGVFPDPITVRQVERWADSLGLDAGQRQSLADAHEDYRARFAELRDGPIERHLKAHTPGFGAARDIRALRDAQRSRRSVGEQIAQLDAQLLSTLHEIAGPASASTVERIRLAEERRRARGAMGMMTLPGSDLELGEELDDAIAALGSDDELEERRAAVEPLVIAYEQRLTRLMSEIADITIRQPLAIAEALDRAGLADVSVRPAFADEGDSDGRQAMARAVRDEVAAPQRRLRGEIVAAHREFVRSLVDRVPAETQRQVRNAMIRRVYRGNVLGRDLESDFAGAISRTERQDAAIAESLRDIRGEYRAARDGVIDALMDAVDAQRRETSGFFMPFSFGEQSGPHAQTQRSLAERRNAIDEEFAARLATVVGVEEAPPRRQRIVTANGIELDLGGAEISVEGGMAVIVGDGGGGGMMIATSAGIPAGSMRGFAGPMLIDALEPLADSAEHLWPVVEILHAEYADRYRHAEEQEQAALREIGGGFPGVGMGMLPPGAGREAGGAADLGRIDRRHAYSRQAVDRLLSLDELFFNDVAAALAGTDAEPLVRRLRGVRQREALVAAAGGGGGMTMMTGSREQNIDLALILHAAEAELDPESRRRLEPSLARWEESATPMQRQRYETVVQQQRIIERTMAQMSSVDQEGRVEISITSETPGFEEYEKAQRRLQEASSIVAEMNRRTRDEMLQQLAPDEARILRRAYGRAAFPGVYRDPQSVAPKLERVLETVLELDDVDGAQYESIAEIVAAHHAAYDDFCDRMVEVESTDTGFRLGGPPDMDAIQAIQTRQNTMRRLRFERSELGAATLRKLESILTPEQIERVGGLEPPAAPMRGAGPVFEFAR